MESRDDLLQPSLTEDRTDATALYSATAGYVTSFFGGPIAAIAFAGVNSRRLGRLRADAPWLTGGLALFAVALWWAFDGRYPASVQPWVQENLRIAARGLGLLYFGAIYLLHRRHYRAMTMMGIESPNGWVVGFACGAIGVLSIIAIGVATTK
jgi:hypothetical protein